MLDDPTSTYFEEHHCPLARYGCSQHERMSNSQILFGVLSNPEGCPAAVKMFECDTAIPKTLAAQVETLRERFPLRQ